jgi:hypothetical protein
LVGEDYTVPGEIEAGQGALAVAPDTPVLEYRFWTGLYHGRKVQGWSLVVGRDAGIAVFRALHFALNTCNIGRALFVGPFRNDA